MIWVTTAKEIQAAAKANMILMEPDEYCVPQWLGNMQQWNEFKKLKDNDE